MQFPLMFSGERIGHETAQGVAKRQLLIDLNKGQPVKKEVSKLEQKLLDPKLKLYSGDVNIEFRCGALKYESLQRLQQDPRLPSGLNTIGNIRAIAGSLKMLAEGGKPRKKLKRLAGDF